MKKSHLASLLGWIVGACTLGVQAGDAPIPVAASQGKSLAPLSAQETLSLKPLDMLALANEDEADEANGLPPRYAFPVKSDIVPGRDGGWKSLRDGRVLWRYRISSGDATSLNFAFVPFQLPPSAALWIYSPSLNERVGPFTADNNSPAQQLWTPVLLANEAIIELSVLENEKHDVQLRISQVGHGYRFFGSKSAYCKSGACNTDVACIADDSPWQEPRRSVAAISNSGTRTCTGSLLNNTLGDRKMLFATATHCGVNPASLVAYWNFESPNCRTPGSNASGSGAVVGPVNQTSTGATLLAQTNNPFAGSGAANTRSDFTLVEFNQPHNPAYNLYWAGWDRTDTAPQCCSPYSSQPCTPARYCASIHHPDGDEKRITFVREPMSTGNISSANGVHWHVRWDLTPSLDLLPNLPLPLPSSLPVSVTEPGSSGSPLYNEQQRFIGVLSGGQAACGRPDSAQYDLYGKLHHAWEGLGTSSTRVKDWLDPDNSGANSIEGKGVCTPPAVPTGLAASANGDNRIDLSWDAINGASGYRIYRGVGSCPGTGFVLIGESDVPQFSDTSVSANISYVYRVSSVDAEHSCESDRGSCASATATGYCALPPSFDGLNSASSTASSTCGIALQWSSATAHCGSSTVYNVYRSQTPGFAPDASSRIASCLNAIALTDLDVGHGNSYEYIVRAEDTDAFGSGQCGGLEENNLIRLSASPGGPPMVIIDDDVESGPGQFQVAGSGAGQDFAIVDIGSAAPNHVWSVAGPAAVSDRQLILPLNLSNVTGETSLQFQHRHDFEISFDGAVLEYSLNGTDWYDILTGNSQSIPANPSRFTAGGYTHTISASYQNPLGGRRAWSGAISAFETVRVNLTDFTGHSIRLRWRFGSDFSQASAGWWIDNFQIIAPQTCGTFDPEIFDDGFEQP